jgi:hypothetical protein
MFMDRRELLGVLGTTVAGLVAVTGRAARADHELLQQGGAHDGCVKA